MRAFKTILVSGGAGFIGSNFIRHILAKKEFTGRIVNIDALTHAGNPLSLRDIEDEHGTKRYIFERADIRDQGAIDRVMNTYGAECIVNFAAESRGDRSPQGSSDLITTNINGAFALLESARAYWGARRDVLFHQVSSGEVFGSIGSSEYISEASPCDPRTPYSASKAAADHLVRAWHSTYGVPVTLSHSSSNYGPYHFPEEMIPLIITNALDSKSFPVYGRKNDVRDWLYVSDHAEAIWQIITKGRIGESYTVGGENEWKNIDLIKHICSVLARATNRQETDFAGLITFVEDGSEHAVRYTVNCAKIKKELGWKQSVDLTRGLELTVRWYLDNQAWVEEVRSGEYARWTRLNFGG